MSPAQNNSANEKNGVCSTYISRSLRKEWKLSNLKWEYSKWQAFVTSQWQIATEADTCFFVYRTFHLVAFITIALVYASLSYKSLEISLRALAYFTMWSYIVCVLNSFYAFMCVTTYKFCRKSEVRLGCSDEGQLSVMLKIYWVLNNIALDTAFATTILYFIGKTFSCKVQHPVYADAAHFWNSILMLMDLFVAQVPIRLVHVYVSVLFGVGYTVFTYVYYYCGGLSIRGTHNIYPLLDWKYNIDKTMLAVFGGLGFLIVFRFVIYGLHDLRCWIYGRYYMQRANDN